MSRVILMSIFACAIFHSGQAGAQSATDRTAVEKRIVADEKAIIDAILKNEPKTFHSHVVGDSFAVGGEGVMKVADFDKMMSQMRVDCKFTKWGLSDSTFYWLTDTSVVHMYKSTIDGTCQDQPVPATWASSVWVNKNGTWLGAFHQESPMTPPPPAPEK
jgi:hypothetical protein